MYTYACSVCRPYFVPCDFSLLDFARPAAGPGQRAYGLKDWCWSVLRCMLAVQSCMTCRREVERPSAGECAPSKLIRRRDGKAYNTTNLNLRNSCTAVHVVLCRHRRPPTAPAALLCQPGGRGAAAAGGLQTHPGEYTLCVCKPSHVAWPTENMKKPCSDVQMLLQLNIALRRNL